MWDHLRKGIKNKDLVVKQLLRLSNLNTFDLSLVKTNLSSQLDWH